MAAPFQYSAMMNDVNIYTQSLANHNRARLHLAVLKVQ